MVRLQNVQREKNNQSSPCGMMRMNRYDKIPGKQKRIKELKKEIEWLKVKQIIVVRKGYMEVGEVRYITFSPI